MRSLVFLVSFVLAFLLFAVQPMATKLVLPTLGGTPAVWNTAMLTFQLLLLVGYAYAHVLVQHVPTRRQWMVHALVVAASFALLPLHIHLESTEQLMHQPIRHLAMAFVLQVGLPFFCLSATAPLLQAWVSRSTSTLKETPYVLYSASNLGSLCGLIGYVLLVEPTLDLSQQTDVWSVLYVGGILALLIAGYRLRPAIAQRAETVASSTGTPWKHQLMWIWLAFLPSALSLGVTSYVATDVASVPLLWVIPLAIYLLSFVDAFRTRPLLVGWCIRLGPLVGMVALLVYGFQGHRFAETFLFHLLAFGMLAFSLHGWLARLKPEAAQLTRFYFCLSIGGALGGALNAIVAPLILNETFEYPISLLLASVTAFILAQRLENTAPMNGLQHVRALLQVVGTVLFSTMVLYLLIGFVSGQEHSTDQVDAQNLMMSASFAAMMSLFIYRRYVKAFYACATVGAIMLWAMAVGNFGMEVIFKERNFFGVERVYDRPLINARFMMHNTTVHGTQYIAPDAKLQPMSYYRSLVEVFETLPAARQHPIAAVGLGAGTMQCHAKAGQRIDYFEINPVVVALAKEPRYFRYLSECPGSYEIFLGDGRVMMVPQPDATYGVIALDAFSSDAIPAHLITTEALQMYLSKLAPGGVLMIHTTNRHLNLWPLLGTQAKALGAIAYAKHFVPDGSEPLVYDSFWVAMAHSDTDLAPLVNGKSDWYLLEPEEGASPWTDAYTNILPYLKMLRE